MLKRGRMLSKRFTRSSAEEEIKFEMPACDADTEQVVLLRPRVATIGGRVRHTLPAVVITLTSSDESEGEDDKMSEANNSDRVPGSKRQPPIARKKTRPADAPAAAAEEAAGKGAAGSAEGAAAQDTGAPAAPEAPPSPPNPPAQPATQPAERPSGPAGGASAEQRHAHTVVADGIDPTAPAREHAPPPDATGAAVQLSALELSVDGEADGAPAPAPARADVSPGRTAPTRADGSPGRTALRPAGRIPATDSGDLRIDDQTLPAAVARSKPVTPLYTPKNSPQHRRRRLLSGGVGAAAAAGSLEQPAVSALGGRRVTEGALVINPRTGALEAPSYESPRLHTSFDVDSGHGKTAQQLAAAQSLAPADAAAGNVVPPTSATPLVTPKNTPQRQRRLAPRNKTVNDVSYAAHAARAAAQQELAAAPKQADAPASSASPVGTAPASPAAMARRFFSRSNTLNFISRRNTPPEAQSPPRADPPAAAAAAAAPRAKPSLGSRRATANVLDDEGPKNPIARLMRRRSRSSTTKGQTLEVPQLVEAGVGDRRHTAG